VTGENEPFILSQEKQHMSYFSGMQFLHGLQKSDWPDLKIGSMNQIKSMQLPEKYSTDPMQ
jgi:hypothetical protein